MMAPEELPHDLQASLQLFADSLVGAANAARRPYDVDRWCDNAVTAFQAYCSAIQLPQPGRREEWQAALRTAIHVALRASARPRCAQDV
jgi:hypothetical protein